LWCQKLCSGPFGNGYMLPRGPELDRREGEGAEVWDLALHLSVRVRAVVREGRVASWYLVGRMVCVPDIIFLYKLRFCAFDIIIMIVVCIQSCIIIVRIQYQVPI